MLYIWIFLTSTKLSFNTKLLLSSIIFSNYSKLLMTCTLLFSVFVILLSSITFTLFYILLLTFKIYESINYYHIAEYSYKFILLTLIYWVFSAFYLRKITVFDLFITKLFDSDYFTCWWTCSLKFLKFAQICNNNYPYKIY